MKRLVDLQLRLEGLEELLLLRTLLLQEGQLVLQPAGRRRERALSRQGAGPHQGQTLRANLYTREA